MYGVDCKLRFVRHIDFVGLEITNIAGVLIIIVVEMAGALLSMGPVCVQLIGLVLLAIILCSGMSPLHQLL